MSVLVYNDIKEIVKKVIQGMSPTETISGVVLSVDPIQVEVDGNSELYPSDNFVIPEHLRDREIPIEYNGANDSTGDGLSFSGTMVIKNGLQVGDQVLILKSQKGQKLIIIDRV